MPADPIRGPDESEADRHARYRETLRGVVRAAVAGLEAALDDAEDTPEAVRDIALLRFLHATDAVWRAAHAVLEARQTVTESTRGATLQGCVSAGLLDAEAEAAISALFADWDALPDAYGDEACLAALLVRLPGHARTLRAWVAVLEREASARA